MTVFRGSALLGCAMPKLSGELAIAVAIGLSLLASSGCSLPGLFYCPNPFASCGSNNCEHACDGDHACGEKDCDQCETACKSGCDHCDLDGQNCPPRGRTGDRGMNLAAMVESIDTLPGRFHPVPTRPVFGLRAEIEPDAAPANPAPVRLAPPQVPSKRTKDASPPSAPSQPRESEPVPLEARNEEDSDADSGGSKLVSARLMEFLGR